MYEVVTHQELLEKATIVLPDTAYCVVRSVQVKMTHLGEYL